MHPRLVITVHGIRTFGQWQERLERLIEQAAPGEVIVRNYHYGYFSALAFVIPFFRWLATRTFRKELSSIIKANPDRQVAIVAHSFGTHLVGWGLRGIPKRERPQIDTVVLAGSVLRSGFPWGDLLDSGSILRVINDCGINDAVLIFSQAFVLMTGMAGRSGFSGMTGARLTNRYFLGGHSHYFLKEGVPSDDFMQRFWVPLLALGTPAERIDERTDQGPIQGLGITVLQIADPLKFGGYFGLLFCMWWFGYHAPRTLAEREALGREGAAAMRMFDADLPPETAAAALVHATMRDSAGTYPGYRDVLSYWLPKLSPLDIPDRVPFCWRERCYFKAEPRLLDIPETGIDMAYMKDDLLFIINGNSVFSMFTISSADPTRLVRTLSVNLAGKDATDKQYLLSDTVPLISPELYYFRENQKIILTGRQMGSHGGEQYPKHVVIDLTGQASNKKAKIGRWSTEADCNNPLLSYFASAHDPKRLERLERHFAFKVEPDSDPPDLLTQIMQSRCASYRVDAPGRGDNSFPSSMEESDFWEVTAIDLVRAAYEELPKLKIGPIKVRYEDCNRYDVPAAPHESSLELTQCFYPNRLIFEAVLLAPDVAPGTVEAAKEEHSLLSAQAISGFAVISPNARTVLLSKDKFPGLGVGWTYDDTTDKENDKVSADDMILITGGRVSELSQVPSEVDGATFTPDSSKLVVMGAGQLFLFNIASGKLIWRTAVPTSRYMGENQSIGLFESPVPIVVSEQAVVSQYGSDEVAAFSLDDGEFLWVSAPMGIKEGRLRFVLSPHGEAMAVFNQHRLRLISTKTGTLLAPLVSFEELAGRLSKDRSEDKSGPIRDVSFEPDGALVIDATSARFKRQAAWSVARVYAVLPDIEGYTGISKTDGKSTILDLHHIEYSGVNRAHGAIERDDSATVVY